MPVPIRVVPSSGALAANVVDSTLLTPSLPAPFTDRIEGLVRIISDYLLTTSPHDQFKHGGRQVLAAQLKWHVKQNVPLELVLPAFPFKCPSGKKVLGVLPDFAEEIVLRRLEDLCSALENVYPPGAHLTIVSDGIVYSQLLGVTDSTAFRYNAELRRMVSSLRLRHISFVRVQGLLSGRRKSSYLSDLSEAEYLFNAPITREQFLSTDIGNYDAEAHIKSDEGALRTYRGYLRFLKLDLEGRDAQVLKKSSGNQAEQAYLSRKTREKLLSTIAKRMMGNRAKFSALVERTFPHAVRLSIHAHTNAGPKFALRLFPGVDFACTPWHNAVVIRLDGSISVQHNQTIDENTHKLVYRYGRPYFWREIDPAMQWSNGIEVTSGRMFPFDLAGRCFPILARGFGAVEKDEYHRKTNEMGTIQQCMWGDILEDPILDMNNTATRESMPMHFDGVFKIITEEDGSITADPALFQVFCSHAPTASSAGADAGGRTLFANTSLTYQQMMGNDTSLLRLRGKTQHVERVHTDGCIIRRKTSRVTFGSEEPVKQPIRYSLA